MKYVSGTVYTTWDRNLSLIQRLFKKSGNSLKIMDHMLFYNIHITIFLSKEYSVNREIIKKILSIQQKNIPMQNNQFMGLELNYFFKVSYSKKVKTTSVLMTMNDLMQFSLSLSLSLSLSVSLSLSLSHSLCLSLSLSPSHPHTHTHKDRQTSSLPRNLPFSCQFILG